MMANVLLFVRKQTVNRGLQGVLRSFGTALPPAFDYSRSRITNADLTAFGRFS